MTPASDALGIARAALARVVLDNSPVAAALGSIELRPEQRASAARLLSVIDRDGGALLAEPVGLGKTYTALAVARHYRDVIIVAPSSLRAMWADSLRATGISAEMISHESLSRGRRPPATAQLIIVDEAHRFRSPGSRRYALLAELCAARRVLLLSATPVQNRHADLCALLALFLGRRAWSMDTQDLATRIVRGAKDTAAIPELRGPMLLALETPDDCLDQLLALPAPVPARDESVAATLLVYGLLHQWTSSRAALVAALRKRQSRAIALLEALSAGRRPTRDELNAWAHCGDAVQLAFPEIASGVATPDDDIDALIVAVDRHAAALNALVGTLRKSPDPDDERAELLRRIRREHSGQRVIAFCQYVETVNALRSRLAADSGVAALTARGARVAGGRVSREMVLAQFQPNAREVSRAERIDLLLATDLLSEGLNLQEASVVVHLDFPWNPARLDQRVGRVRRLGSRHASVTVYAIAPPAAADRLLKVEQRLREKLNVAQRTIGIAGRILPSPLLVPADSRSAAERLGNIDARLRRWTESGTSGDAGREPIIVFAKAPRAGFVCALRGARSRVIADIGKGIQDSAAAIESALETIEHATPAVPDPQRLERVIVQIDAWLQTDRGASTIDFSIAAAARSRRRALERVSKALARAPRHRRAQLADLAAAARLVATSPLGEGAERILETLVSAELPDEAWLRSVATFGELNARPVRPARAVEAGRIAVLIVFGPAVL